VRHPEKVDVIIFRENTEDVYAGIEYKSGSPENIKLAKFLREEMGADFFDEAGLGIKPISPFASKRLVRKAIQYAIDHGRDSVTLVHKGNIMKFTEGAFRNWGYELARDEFPDQTITENDLYSVYGGKQPPGKSGDQGPHRRHHFPVAATASGRVLGIGHHEPERRLPLRRGSGGSRRHRHRPGANMADHVAVFEATHGTAPKYANLDKVNPGSLMLSGVMMLQYMGWIEAAELIESALTR
jgi:isocitrate dehydrogenase